MKKIAFIFLAFVLVIFSGCAVKETVKEQTEIPETAIDTGADAATSESISEADSIAQIEDTEADSDIEDAANSLADW